MRKRILHAEKPEVLDLFSRAEEDEGAREELVRRFQPLARAIASRFTGRGEATEDLQQVAMVGLVCAMDRFEPERDVRFATYAGSVITGELKRHLRDRGWDVHVPRSLKDTAVTVAQALPEISQEVGRTPTTGEIAERLRLEESEVVEAIGALRAYTAAPIDQTGVVDEPGDIDQSSADQIEVSESWSEIAPLLRQLPIRERVILYLRYFEGRTQAEIALALGLSQMHVSRILGRTLDQLRERASA
jgi:RNA polymerase sigma-B factor